MLRDLAAPARAFFIGIVHGSLPQTPVALPLSLSPGPALTARNLNLQFWKTSCSQSSLSALCLPDNRRGGQAEGKGRILPCTAISPGCATALALDPASIFPRRYLGRLSMSPWHRSDFTLPFKNCKVPCWLRNFDRREFQTRGGGGTQRLVLVTVWSRQQ